MITITKKIKELLENFTETQKKIILEGAWDACCDGEWLGQNYNDSETFLDPWAISNSELCAEIEEEAVDQCKRSYIFQNRKK